MPDTPESVAETAARVLSLSSLDHAEMRRALRLVVRRIRAIPLKTVER